MLFLAHQYTYFDRWHCLRKSYRFHTFKFKYIYKHGMITSNATVNGRGVKSNVSNISVCLQTLFIRMLRSILR